MDRTGTLDMFMFPSADPSAETLLRILKHGHVADCLELNIEAVVAALEYVRWVTQVACRRGERVMYLWFHELVLFVAGPIIGYLVIRLLVAQPLPRLLYTVMPFLRSRRTL